MIGLCFECHKCSYSEVGEYGEKIVLLRWTSLRRVATSERHENRVLAWSHAAVGQISGTEFVAPHANGSIPGGVSNVLTFAQCFIEISTRSIYYLTMERNLRPYAAPIAFFTCVQTDRATRFFPTVPICAIRVQ